MNRRHFFTIAGIGGGIAALAFGRFLTTSFEDSSEKLIRKELSFLRLETEGIRRFLGDYGRTKDERFKLTIKGYGFLGITASQSGKIHQMVSSYLLSSDFFMHNQNESREIKYIGLYDPYTRPCTHPFSHLRYPGDAAITWRNLSIFLLLLVGNPSTHQPG